MFGVCRLTVAGIAGFFGYSLALRHFYKQLLTAASKEILLICVLSCRVIIIFASYSQYYL